MVLYFSGKIEELTDQNRQMQRAVLSWKYEPCPTLTSNSCLKIETGDLIYKSIVQ